MQVWYRADAGAESSSGNPAGNGNTVQFWRDQSNNTFDASQGTVANRPLFVDPAHNTQPALQFDGSKLPSLDGDYLSAGDVLNQGSNSFTLFTVFSSPFRTVGANEMLWEKRELGGQQRDRMTIYLRRDSDPGLNFVYGDGTNVVSPAVGTDYTQLLNGSPHISAAVVDRLGNTAYHYLNGGAPATDDITGFGSQSNTNPLYIGRGNFQGSDNFQGQIAEVLLYRGALTADELNDVGWYLQTKYGVTGHYIPEPSAMLLLLAGMISLALVRRRK